jgi:hypothetical protein
VTTALFNSWFQTFTLRWILIFWFWGFTRCVGWISWRRFGTHSGDSWPDSWGVKMGPTVVTHDQTHDQWRWDSQWWLMTSEDGTHSGDSWPDSWPVKMGPTVVTHDQWRWDPQWFPELRQLIQPTYRVKPQNQNISTHHCLVKYSEWPIASTIGRGYVLQ